MTGVVVRLDLAPVVTPRAAIVDRGAQTTRVVTDGRATQTEGRGDLGSAEALFKQALDLRSRLD